MTRHVPNRKGVGAELSGLYVFPPHPSITGREAGVLDAKSVSQTFCHSNNKHLLIRHFVPTRSQRKINVVLAFVVKLEPLIAQKMSCLVSYPIGRRWGKEHAHAFDFD